MKVRYIVIKFFKKSKKFEKYLYSLKNLVFLNKYFENFIKNLKTFVFFFNFFNLFLLYFDIIN